MKWTRWNRRPRRLSRPAYRLGISAVTHRSRPERHPCGRLRNSADPRQYYSEACLPGNAVLFLRNQSRSRVFLQSYLLDQLRSKAPLELPAIAEMRLQMMIRETGRSDCPIASPPAEPLYSYTSISDNRLEKSLNPLFGPKDRHYHHFKGRYE